MREILFRAKAINRDLRMQYRTDYKNGDWVYGLISSDREYHDTHFTEMTNTDGVSGIDVDRETVCEYTGLSDTNGTKIFEGDVVKITDKIVDATYYARVEFGKRCNSNGEHYEGEFELIEEVVFKNGTFCFETDFEGIAMYRPIGFEIYEKQKIKSFEIIGNIHDNPELLKNTNE